MQGSDGEPAAHCTTVWWPRYQQAGAHGACGSSPLPPETAYGRRRPEEVMAKPYGFPYGFLDAAEPATDHFMLSGYARARAASAPRLGRGPPGDPGRAVPGHAREGEADEGLRALRLLGRLRAESARHAVFEIVAYGAGGDEIGRYRWRSDVTN